MKQKDTEKKILELAKITDITKLSYRKIGKIIGVDHPQIVKYYVQKLIKLGKEEFVKVHENNSPNNYLIYPIYSLKKPIKINVKKLVGFVKIEMGDKYGRLK